MIYRTTNINILTMTKATVRIQRKIVKKSLARKDIDEAADLVITAILNDQD